MEADTARQQAVDALRALYLPRLKAYRDRLAGLAGISAPLLIDPPVEYFACPNRLMIVGQETVRWGEGELQAEARHSLDAVTGLYRSFAMGEQYFATPFWRAARILQQSLNPDSPSSAFIWSNLSKVDENGHRPSRETETTVRETLGILPDEVAILKPRAVIFFTGPNYDDLLSCLFPGARRDSVPGFTPRQLVRISHTGLPSLSYRIYHPGYLARTKRLPGTLAAVASLLGAEPVTS